LLLIVAIKGKDADHLNLTVSSHSKYIDESEFDGENYKVSWLQKSLFKSNNFKIT
jgi:hypothetical protein